MIFLFPSHLQKGNLCYININKHPTQFSRLDRHININKYEKKAKEGKKKRSVYKAIPLGKRILLTYTHTHPFAQKMKGGTKNVCILETNLQIIKYTLTRWLLYLLFYTSQIMYFFPSMTTDVCVCVCHIGKKIYVNGIVTVHWRRCLKLEILSAKFWSPWNFFCLPCRPFPPFCVLSVYDVTQPFFPSFFLLTIHKRKHRSCRLLFPSLSSWSKTSLDALHTLYTSSSIFLRFYIWKLANLIIYVYLSNVLDTLSLSLHSTQFLVCVDSLGFLMKTFLCFYLFVFSHLITFFLRSTLQRCTLQRRKIETEKKGKKNHSWNHYWLKC